MSFSGSGSKESACNARDLGSIPGVERLPQGGHGNPLQYSCLENPMDRGAWWATVQKVRHNQVTKTLWFHFQGNKYQGNSLKNALMWHSQTKIFCNVIFEQRSNYHGKHKIIFHLKCHLIKCSTVLNYKITFKRAYKNVLWRVKKH